VANPTDKSRPVRTTLLLLSGLLASCSVFESRGAVYDRAQSAYLQGDLFSALAQASAGASRFGSDSKSPWSWKFKLLQAETLAAQSRITEARALLRNPVPTGPGLGKDGPDLSQLEVRRLLDLVPLTPLNERVKLFQQARAAVTDPELAIRLQINEGVYLVNAADPDARLRQALATAQHQGNAYWQAAALLNLSYNSKKSRRYEEAVQLGLRAVAVAEQVKARRLAALARGNLGSAYNLLGEADAALQNQELAIRYFQANGLRQNLMTALGEIGLIQDARDDSQAAIDNYTRAFRLARELNGDGDAERNAGNLALTLIKARKWDQAEEWNRKALQLAPNVADKGSVLYLIRNQARIAYGRGHPEEARRICDELLHSETRSPNLRWEVYAFMGTMDAEARRFPLANREFESALKIIDENRAELAVSQFRMTLLSRLIPFYQDYVDALVQQNNQAAAIRIAESSRARVLTELMQRDQEPDRFPDLASLQAVARSTNSTLLSFWLAPLRSYAWLIGAERVRFFQLPPSGEIEKLVTEYRKKVEHALQDPILAKDPAGPNLWNALMLEIGPAIPKDSRLIVIPDGALHRLNLETLVAPSPQPHYWIDDVEIGVAPSITIAASKPGPQAARDRSLLLIGAPDYAGSGFEPLKNAGKEVDEIEARFPAPSRIVLTGARAAPAAYKDSNPVAFAYIHFAAHAEADSQNPLGSAVILSGQSSRNRLYARDVIDIPIHADLVTISACSSAGVRSYGGEGLIGFAWAFLRAGAHGVVAGLWDVSDTATEPLMDRFYAGIGAGLNPITALRRAKLALRKDDPRFAKPFYWAPFQTYVASAARQKK
jgi:CHAT domain-containing protein